MVEQRNKYLSLSLALLSVFDYKLLNSVLSGTEPATSKPECLLHNHYTIFQANSPPQK